MHQFSLQDDDEEDGWNEANRGKADLGNELLFFGGKLHKFKILDHKVVEVGDDRAIHHHEYQKRDSRSKKHHSLLSLFLADLLHI